MEYLKLFVQAIGHLAWPIVVFLIAISFKNEIAQLLKRVKKAKYKGVELDLENDFQEMKKDAMDAGITMMYSPSTFQQENFEAFKQAPEWVFIKTWQEIDNLLNNAYKAKIDKVGKTPPTSRVISALVDNAVINSEMASLIRKMNEIRNKIVHSSEFEITRGELLEWLGISRSITDRLSQQLQG